MALANIACLLAEDREHPQRVLVWDFDLEAPGLHKLLPPPEPFRRGFVDLAFEFAESGRVPDPTDYVYRSESAGVDVLPAGRVDESYCRKLERIDWPSFFGTDPSHKGQLFEELTSWMHAAPQKYDYVLIDSRTGLNDAAGICTQVLPDLVLFIFRLTDQNLEGVEHLVPVMHAQLKARGKGKVEIFPVASMVPSQSSKEVAERHKRAKSVFKTKDLSYVRFDADLIANEKLFCRHDVKSALWPVPSTVDDYERLCGWMRRKNEDDTKTAARLLRRAMREGDYTRAQTILGPLLRYRPMVRQTWTYLRLLCKAKRDGTRFGDKLADEVLRQSRDNVFALEWMASKRAEEAQSIDDESLEKALDHLEKAIEIKPNESSLHRKIAEIASATGDLQRADKALERSHELSPGNLQIRMDLANLYVRRGRDYFVKALDVLEQGERETEEAVAVYLWTFLEDEEKAQRAFDRFSDGRLASHIGGYAQLVKAHCLLLQGMVDSARKLAVERLGSEDEPGDEGERVNWAEFFLCAEDFGKVREMFRVEEADGSEGKNLAGLCALAEYLEGETSVDESSVLSNWGVHSWNFTELLFFRERVRRTGKEEYGSRLDVIEKLIRTHALSSQFTHSEESVFWRRSTGAERRIFFGHGSTQVEIRGVGHKEGQS